MPEWQQLGSFRKFETERINQFTQAFQQGRSGGRLKTLHSFC